MFGYFEGFNVFVYRNNCYIHKTFLSVMLSKFSTK
jgi:hypothetical protein